MQRKRPSTGATKITLRRLERTAKKIKHQGECWVWQGARCMGYGITFNNWRVHRLFYYVAHGELPPILDHLCRNRACANPKHLEPVTARENLMRGDTWASINANKTHCKRGHPFSKENTRITSDYSRACRTCNRERMRVYA